MAVNRRFHDHECHYYDERFAIRHDERSAHRALAEVQAEMGEPVRPDWRVLDVGCGTGYLVAGLRRAVPGLRLVGADLSAGMLGRARVAGGWPLVQADAGRLPVATGSVDLLVARGVLHHLEDPAAALAEWRRVLAPGGRVVLTSEPTPAVECHGALLVRALLLLLRPWPLSPEAHFWELASMAANLHLFTPGRVGKLAAEAGYAAWRVRSTGFAETLLLTASYVAHGRVRAAARRLPWARLVDLARRLDTEVWDRVLSERSRHTVAAVLYG